jgi:hypothetical protein
MESNSITITPPDSEGYNQRGAQIVASATGLMIQDDAGFMDGGKMLTSIKTITKNLETEFADPVEKAHKAHKAMVALRDKALYPFRQAEQIIKQKLGIYQAYVEKQRQEEADKLRKEAEAKAEADRIAKAQEQMDNGDLKGCEKTLEAPPAFVPPPRVTTPEPPKVAGVSFKDVWKFEVVDPSQLPPEYLMPNETAIRRTVSGLMGKTNIPGVRVWSEKGVSGRGF